MTKKQITLKILQNSEHRFKFFNIRNEKMYFLRHLKMSRKNCQKSMIQCHEFFFEPVIGYTMKIRPKNFLS